MSIIVDDCLKYVVGLSRTECNCDYYANCGDFNESESGLYIDELSPINTVVVKARADCEKGELCNIMDVARSNAIKQFKTDVYGLIMRTHHVRKERYNQAIGTKTYNGTTTLSNTYQVARFVMNNVVGGSFEITNILTGFDSTAAFELLVYNNINELVTTLNISSTANLWQENAISLSLPTFSRYIENLEYYFVYRAADVGNPFDNTVQFTENCASGCPSKTNKQLGWLKWMNYYGAGKNDLDFRDWDVTGNKDMGGLIFEVDLKCDISRSICDEQLDFTSDPVALGIAKAIQYLSAIQLIDLILSSPELIQKVLINRETMLDYRVLFDKKYEELMYFDKRNPKTGLIEKGLKINNTDCFQCSNNWGLRKTTILS